MSTYFDFTIERPKNNEWICVAKSNYDDNLDIINPYILKSAFWDADYSNNISSLNENELSNETFLHFANKKNKINGYYSILVENNYGNDVVEFLKSVSNTKYKCNDIVLWLHKDVLLKNKEFLKFSLSEKNTNCDDWKEFRNEIDSIDTYSKLDDVLNKCDNVIVDGNEVGIVFNETAYSVSENLKYNPHYKKLDIRRVSILEYYEDANKTKLKKQYELHGHVSYKKDIEFMISEIDKSLERMENSKKAEEIAKSYIASILEDYEYDEDMKNNELYKRLYEYSENSEEYDYEYTDELIAQKRELELMLRFVGENGRLIWNIE